MSRRVALAWFAVVLVALWLLRAQLVHEVGVPFRQALALGLAVGILLDVAMAAAVVGLALCVGARWPRAGHCTAFVLTIAVSFVSMANVAYFSYFDTRLEPWVITTHLGDLTVIGGSVRQVLLSAPALTAWLVAIPLFLVGRRWTGLRSSTPVVSARSGALCACSAALIALAAAPIKRGVLHGGTSVLAEQVLVAWIEEARGRITDQQLAWSGIAESLRDAVALDASAPDRVLASFWQWHPQRERWPNADFGVARPLVRELEPQAMHTLALRERLGLPVEGPIHVIILFLESVRAFEMEHPALGPKVFPRTRALLASHALRFPTAYASAPHAAKTVQGQFTTLCSLLPGPSGGAVYLWYPNVRVKCLAEVAREHGYHTLWISGGTEDFQKKRLFESLHGTDSFFGAEYLASIPYKGRQFECGYPDGPMLQEAVRILEREAQDGRPVFANVLTLSTHHPVSEIPEGPVPATLRAAAKRGPADKDYVGYLSRLRYLDESLASFFDTLFASPIGDRTLVVMLGDHGARYKPHIPVAQHQVVELMARIPLAIVTKGLRAPSVSSYPVHQVDVAPTVADIIGFHSIVAWIGRDILDGPGSPWLLGEQERLHYRVGNRACYTLQGDDGPTCYRVDESTDPMLSFDPPRISSAAAEVRFFQSVAVAAGEAIASNLVMPVARKR